MLAFPEDLYPRDLCDKLFSQILCWGLSVCGGKNVLFYSFQTVCANCRGFVTVVDSLLLD